MLITFTSKAAAEVTMYKEHAKRILDLLGKDVNRGVITAAEAPQAVDVLEKEIAETRMHQASDDVQRDVHAHHGDVGEDTEHEGMEVVSFATRAYPLLEMLRAARNGGFDVLWGV
jgi:polyhydroxyalkanoate synthesis regulator phasin